MTAAEFFEVAPPVAAVASNEPVERVTAEAMDGNRRKGARMARQDSQKPVDSSQSGGRRLANFRAQPLSQATLYLDCSINSLCALRRALDPMADPKPAYPRRRHTIPRRSLEKAGRRHTAWPRSRCAKPDGCAVRASKPTTSLARSGSMGRHAHSGGEVPDG
jgi:hypothetical protein